MQSRLYILIISCFILATCKTCPGKRKWADPYNLLSPAQVMTLSQHWARRAQNLQEKPKNFKIHWNIPNFNFFVFFILYNLSKLECSPYLGDNEKIRGKGYRVQARFASYVFLTYLGDILLFLIDFQPSTMNQNNLFRTGAEVQCPCPFGRDVSWESTVLYCT